MEIFSPLNVPLEKHIQALVAWSWIFTCIFLRFFTTTILLYIAFFTSYSPLAFLYVVWAYFDKETPYRGGRRSWYIQDNRYWKYFIDYFPSKLVKTADIKPDKNYLFCYHPHGVLPAGAFAHFCNYQSDCRNLYPGLKMYCVSLDINFHFPLLREYSLAIGGIASSKESLKCVLEDKGKKGNVVVLSTGGASEALFATPGPYRLVVKNRKGFVKLALETGTALVPVFGFGEIDLYKQFNPPGSTLYNIQIWIKKFLGYAPCLPIGRGILLKYGVVPYNKPLTVVVGKQIDVPKLLNPTQEEIDKYHSLFIEALVDLFNKYKGQFTKDGDNSEIILT